MYICRWLRCLQPRSTRWIDLVALFKKHNSSVLELPAMFASYVEILLGSVPKFTIKARVRNNAFLHHMSDTDYYENGGHLW
jgi:hypothetical protein